MHSNMAPEVRVLSREKATAEIVTYLLENGQTDSFDMALALDLDPEQVESLCAELAMSGRLAVK